MEATVTKNGTFERIVEVDVPEDELTPHFDEAYQKYQKKLRLQGFRKGKVPLSLIKKLYGDSIKSEALDDVVQSVFREVRDKEGLRPIAPAKLQDVNYDPVSGLHFKAVVEVVPDIELKTYTGLAVERETYQIDDQDVAQALEEYRERVATMEPVEEAAQEDHFVVADFQQVDTTGLPIIGRKFEDRLIHLSTLDQSRDLSDQLIGVKPGETRRVQLDSVDANGNKGETALYEVNVKEIKSKRLPELDDELAKDVSDFETLDQLKENIRARLELQSQASARRTMRQRLIDELLKKNPFDLPESMVTNYLDVLVEGARKDSSEPFDEAALRDQYRPTTVWNIKWELVKDKLQEVENITTTEEDKNRLIARIAGERGVTEREIKQSLQKRKAQARFEEDVLEEKILDFLEERAKIKERKVTRKDIEKGRKLII